MGCLPPLQKTGAQFSQPSIMFEKGSHMFCIVLLKNVMCWDIPTILRPTTLVDEAPHFRRCLANAGARTGPIVHVFILLDGRHWQTISWSEEPVKRGKKYKRPLGDHPDSSQVFSKKMFRGMFLVLTHRCWAWKNNWERQASHRKLLILRGLQVFLLLPNFREPRATSYITT